MLQSVILLWKCAFQAGMSVSVLVCATRPLPVYQIVFRHPVFNFISFMCVKSEEEGPGEKKTLSNILNLDCNTCNSCNTEIWVCNHTMSITYSTFSNIGIKTLQNVMLTHEDIYDCASFGCVDGSNLLHLCFNFILNPKWIDKNAIFSAFFFLNVVKLYETYASSVDKKKYVWSLNKTFFVCLFKSGASVLSFAFSDIHTTKYSGGHERFVKMTKNAGGGWQLKKHWQGKN